MSSRNNHNPNPRAAKEELVLTFSPSWKGMIGWYIKRLLIALIICVLFGVLWQNETLSVYWFLLVCFISIGGVLGLGKLIRQATVYRISTRRVSETTGIFNKKTESAFFTEITNTTVEQSIIERILKVGRVDFDTAGERLLRVDDIRGKSSKNYLAFWGVPHPHSLEATVDGLRFGDHDLGDDFEEPVSDPSAIAPATVGPSAAELRRMAEEKEAAEDAALFD